MSESDFRDVHAAIQVFTEYNRPWAVCGGWAIDLHMDRVTRTHKDVDFAILRSDQLIVQNFLLRRGWTLAARRVDRSSGPCHLVQKTKSIAGFYGIALQ